MDRAIGVLPLLVPEDGPPFDAIDGDGIVLFLCDHASRRIPAALGDLGLAPLDRVRHIAWDIGASDVTCELVSRFNCPAILAGFSRLVVDVNRPPGHATSMPTHSEDTAIPGNTNLSDGDRTRRARACFEPYHGAIRERLARFAADKVVPAIVAMHSFTPVYHGVARPWEVGVLWDNDPRIAVPLMKALAAQGVHVGDNQPYSARNETGYTVAAHAAPAGFPHVMIEVRQDLIGGREGVRRMADILERALAPIFADPELYGVEHYRQVPAWVDEPAPPA